MRRRAGVFVFAPWWKTSSRSLSYFSIWWRCWFSRISRRFSSTRTSSSPRSESPFLATLKIFPRIDMLFLEQNLRRLRLPPGLLFLDGRLLGGGLLPDRGLL